MLLPGTGGPRAERRAKAAPKHALPSRLHAQRALQGQERAVHLCAQGVSSWHTRLRRPSANGLEPRLADLGVLCSWW